MNYTDVHCHILPGLDDGASSIEESKEMFQIAYQEGIRSMIVTPHNYATHRSASPEKIRETIEKVEEHLKEWELPICLYPGNEIYYRNGVAEKLEEGKILSLAGSTAVLVEFDPGTEYSYLRDGLQELIRFGYEPILAHTERYGCLFTKKERLQELQESGVRFQVNASSFFTKLGSEPRKRARGMLKGDWIDFIGTDAHSSGHRSPKIEECASYIKAKKGSEEAHRLLVENPAALLENIG